MSLSLSLSDHSASIQKLEWNHRGMNHFHSILAHPTQHSLMPWSIAKCLSCQHKTCTSTSYHIIHITPHFPCSLHLHFCRSFLWMCTSSDLFIAFPLHWFSGHEYVSWDLGQFSGSYDFNGIYLIFHWYLLIVVNLKCLLNCFCKMSWFCASLIDISANLGSTLANPEWKIVRFFQLSIFIHKFSTT